MRVTRLRCVCWHKAQRDKDEAAIMEYNSKFGSQAVAQYVESVPSLAPHASMLRAEPPQLNMPILHVKHGAVSSYSENVLAALRNTRNGQQLHAVVLKHWEHIHRILQGNNPSLPAALVSGRPISKSISEGECLCGKCGNM